MTRSAVFSRWAFPVLAASAAALTRPAAHMPSPGSGRRVRLAGVSPPAWRPPFEAALHEPRRWHVRARRAARYRREAEDEGGLAVDREPERLRQMTADRYGYLRRALDAAHRAEGMARTPDERYRVAELLSRLEGEAGRSELELR